MGIGVSIILMAVGAVLAWAVERSPEGVNVNTIGYILLAVGALGALLSLAFWSSWAGPGYWSRGRRAEYVEEGAPVARRRRVYEEEV